MKLNDITVGLSVIVREDAVDEGSHEFSAVVNVIYPKHHHKHGMVCVRDQDDDCFDVLPMDIMLDDGADEDDSSDDEHDQFRHDGEADGDALASAGMGTDEDYEHGTPDGDDY